MKRTLGLVLFVLLSGTVLAIPGVPNAFYGYVTVNGQPAPDGTQVTAKIDGTQVAATTTSGGRYGYNPALYIDDPKNDRTGKAISLFVNGMDTGQTSYFCNGCVVMLNLSAGANQQQGAQGGGGGGPAGGQATQSNTTNQNASQPAVTTPASCTERWLCEDWAACTEGIQNRTCEDANKCGTYDNKPLESQPCSSGKEATLETQDTQPKTTQEPATGFAALAGLDAKNMAAGILLILAIALVMAYSRKTKANFPREPENNKS